MDPGGATGLAWAVLNPHASLPEALNNRLRAGSTTIEGDEREQIKKVVSLWSSFYRQSVERALLPPENVFFVCEDFIPKPGQTGGGKDMSISISVIWGVEGYRMGRADEWAGRRKGKPYCPPMILQLASQASTFATDKRLREWGLWVKGRDHERSAHRHMAMFLAKYKQGRGLK